MAGLPAMPELALVGGTPGAKVSVTFLNEATGPANMVDAGQVVNQLHDRGRYYVVGAPAVLIYSGYTALKDCLT